MKINDRNQEGRDWTMNPRVPTGIETVAGTTRRPCPKGKEQGGVALRYIWTRSCYSANNAENNPLREHLVGRFTSQRTAEPMPARRPGPPAASSGRSFSPCAHATQGTGRHPKRGRAAKTVLALSHMTEDPLLNDDLRTLLRAFPNHALRDLIGVP